MACTIQMRTSRPESIARDMTRRASKPELLFHVKDALHDGPVSRERTDVGVFSRLCYCK